MHTGVFFDMGSYFFRNAEMVSEEGAEKFFHDSRFLGSIGLRRVLGCLPGNRLFLRIHLDLTIAFRLFSNDPPVHFIG